MLEVGLGSYTITQAGSKLKSRARSSSEGLERNNFWQKSRRWKKEQKKFFFPEKTEVAENFDFSPPPTFLIFLKFSLNQKYPLVIGSNQFEATRLDPILASFCVMVIIALYSLTFEPVKFINALYYCLFIQCMAPIENDDRRSRIEPGTKYLI